MWRFASGVTGLFQPKDQSARNDGISADLPNRLSPRSIRMRKFPHSAERGASIAAWVGTRPGVYFGTGDDWMFEAGVVRITSFVVGRPTHSLPLAAVLV